MRVITASSFSLNADIASVMDGAGDAVKAPPSPPSTNDAGDGEGSGSASAQCTRYVRALSGVLRLGRAGAATDHSSVLFDVDLSSGVVKRGTTNAHWYQLGPARGLQCPWLPPKGVAIHPDPPHPQVEGKVVPGIKEALEIVTR